MDIGANAAQMTGSRHRGVAGLYLLGPGHIIIPTFDIVAWALARSHVSQRRVAWTRLAPDIWVSTVFLGIDHNFLSGGPPLVFETMVHSDYGWDDQVRYCTWDEAEAGHHAMVETISARIRGPGRAAP